VTSLAVEGQVQGHVRVKRHLNHKRNVLANLGKQRNATHKNAQEVNGVGHGLGQEEVDKQSKNSFLFLNNVEYNLDEK